MGIDWREWFVSDGGQSARHGSKNKRAASFVRRGGHHGVTEPGIDNLSQALNTGTSSQSARADDTVFRARETIAAMVKSQEGQSGRGSSTRGLWLRHLNVRERLNFRRLPVISDGALVRLSKIPT